MLTRVDPDDPAITRTPRWQINEHRQEERMELERIRPKVGEVYRIYKHPQYGDVRRSNVHVTIVGITEAGPWVRVPGQPVLVVTWEQWEGMVDAEA